MHHLVATLNAARWRCAAILESGLATACQLDSRGVLSMITKRSSLLCTMGESPRRREMTCILSRQGVCGTADPHRESGLNSGDCGESAVQLHFFSVAENRLLSASCAAVLYFCVTLLCLSLLSRLPIPSDSDTANVWPSPHGSFPTRTLRNRLVRMVLDLLSLPLLLL